MGLFSEYDPSRREVLKIITGTGTGAMAVIGIGFGADKLKNLWANPALAVVLGELGGRAHLPLTGMDVEAISPLSGKIMIRTPAVTFEPTESGYSVFESGLQGPSLALTSDWKIDVSRIPGIKPTQQVPYDIPSQLASEIQRMSDFEYYEQSSSAGKVLWYTDYSPDHGRMRMGKDGSAGWSMDVSCGRDRGDRSFRNTPFTVFDINIRDPSWHRGASVMYGVASGKRWKVTNEAKVSRPGDDALSKTTAYLPSGEAVIFDDTGPNGETRLLTITGLEGGKTTVALPYTGRFLGGQPMHQIAQMIAITGIRDWRTVLQTFAKLDYLAYGVNLKPAIEEALKRK